MGMSKSREQLRELASITRSLSSLEELADPIVEVFRRIEDGAPEIPKEHTLAMIMGSRGTYPFFLAASHISENNILPSPKNIKIIPHIFSVENLIEILSNDNLQYNAYADILDTLYTQIAEKLSRKINMITSQNGPTIIADWDEVNSGNNLVERLRIYNKMTTGKAPFFITSFVGNQGRNLKKENIEAVRSLQQKSPDTHHHITVRADEDISWSDNEGFFEMTKILYPGIAAPSTVHVRNLIPKRHLSKFYTTFFRSHGESIGRIVGGHTHAQYKLIPVNESTLATLQNEHSILERSLDAYLRAVESTAEGKHNPADHLRGEFALDEESGTVIRIKPNGKTQILLARKDTTTPAHFPKYRDPFTLVYDHSAPAALNINRVLQAYFSDVQSYNTKHQSSIHAGTPNAA